MADDIAVEWNLADCVIFGAFQRGDELSDFILCGDDKFGCFFG